MKVMNIAIAIKRYRKMLQDNLSIVQRQTLSGYGRLIFRKLERLSDSERKLVMKMANEGEK